MDSFEQNFGRNASQPVPVNTGKKRKLGTIILVIVIILLAAGVVFLGWNWWQMRKQFQKLTMPEGVQELQKKQTDETLAKVKKLIALPEGEDPIIATVTDANALKKESDFYALAENNDVVIIYTKAKKAFLYDPDKNIILNVGPVITESTPSPSVSASASASKSASLSPTPSP
jgi:hypothetical protein